MERKKCGICHKKKILNIKYEIKIEIIFKHLKV